MNLYTQCKIPELRGRFMAFKARYGNLNLSGKSIMLGCNAMPRFVSGQLFCQPEIKKILPKWQSLH